MRKFNHAPSNLRHNSSTELNASTVWAHQGHVSRLHEECTVCVYDSTSIELMSLLSCYRPKIAYPLKHTVVIGQFCSIDLFPSYNMQKI